MCLNKVKRRAGHPSFYLRVLAHFLVVWRGGAAVVTSVLAFFVAKHSPSARSRNLNWLA